MVIASTVFGIAELTCLLLPPLPLLTFRAIIIPSVSSSFRSVEILLGVNGSTFTFKQASEYVLYTSPVEIFLRPLSSLIRIENRTNF